MQVNGVIQKNTPEQEMPRLRITAADIQEVKRLHILENLLYTPKEAGEIIGKSPKGIIELVKQKKLIAVDENAKKGENGLKASVGIRITASSLSDYIKSVTVAPEMWDE